MVLVNKISLYYNNISYKMLNVSKLKVQQLNLKFKVFCCLFIYSRLMMKIKGRNM